MYHVKWFRRESNGHGNIVWPIPICSLSEISDDKLIQLGIVALNWRRRPEGFRAKYSSIVELDRWESGTILIVCSLHFKYASGDLVGQESVQQARYQSVEDIAEYSRALL